MMTSYALEEHVRAYRESRLAEAARARLAAAIPRAHRTQRKGGSIMTAALRYVRYALTSLASVAFGLGVN